MAELLYRIGRFATRRRGTVVLVWLAVLAAAAAAFVLAGGTPNGQITIPGTPTAQVTDRLEAAFPKAAGGSGTIVFHTADGSPISAAQQAAIADRKHTPLQHLLSSAFREHNSARRGLLGFQASHCDLIA